MPTTPQCPRCGYDLSGLVASWVESCPMEATCAECGLVFNCGNALNPRLSGPPWSFEHGMRRLFHRFLATSWMALRPWRLGRELSMEHAIRPLRLAVFAAAWLLLSQLISGTILMYDGAFGRRAAFSRFDLRAFKEFLWSYTTDIILPSLTITFVPALFMSFWVMVSGAALGRAGVRCADLFRGLAYSLPTICIAATIFQLFTTVVPSQPQVGSFGFQRFMASLIPFLTVSIVLGFFVCLGAWWWFFIRRYVHLPQAVLIAALSTVLSMVSLLVLGLVVEHW